ncbi:hypothetical protein J2Y48_000123 [Mycoplana sp. BE70]|nr:hypothetical protein [Mycoplana sp. BE70]
MIVLLLSAVFLTIATLAAVAALIDIDGRQPARAAAIF